MGTISGLPQACARRLQFTTESKATGLMDQPCIGVRERERERERGREEEERGKKKRER